MRRRVLCLPILLIGACAAQSPAPPVRPGDTRAEVLRLWGSPDEASTRDGTETLIYRRLVVLNGPPTADHIVELQDGRVAQVTVERGWSWRDLMPPRSGAHGMMDVLMQPNLGSFRIR